MRRILFIAAWLLGSVGLAQAEKSDFPDKPNPPRLVNDFTGTLRADQAAALEQSLNTFNDSTSIEISVVILHNIGDYDISDYAARLGDLWGIGKKQKDDGVLLLIALENRQAFIATGYGMEGVLPDSRCHQIITTDLIPQFRQGDYYRGIVLTTDAIMGYSKGEYTGDPKSGKKISPFPVFFIILLIILIVGFFNKGNSGGRRGNRGMGGYTFGGGFGGFGGGGGYSGGSSGGGFGGFGGGGFGGGGSGGSW